MLCDASVLDDSDLIRGLLLLVVYSEPGGMYIYTYYYPPPSRIGTQSASNIFILRDIFLYYHKLS